MRQEFSLVQGLIRESASGPIRVYTAPSAEERVELLASCGIDEHTLASMLDPEEVPRVEVEADHTIIIWKRPDPASFRTAGLFEVSSLGIVLHRDRITFVAPHEPPEIQRKRTRPVTSINDLLIRELLEIVRHYVDHLKVIKLISREMQTKLNASIGNEYLLQMFGLGESLVYYVNAIEANGGALLRLRAVVERIGFSVEETRILDDLLIENTQCGRQASIYSQVLSGLMDARGNIVNNNMNVLLKNLTVINVVFLPLGILAGVGGMSEYSMMTAGIPWWVAYPLFLMGLAGIGIVTWSVLGRWMDRSMGRSRGFRRARPLGSFLKQALQRFRNGPLAAARAIRARRNTPASR